MRASGHHHYMAEMLASHPQTPGLAQDQFLPQIGITSRPAAASQLAQGSEASQPMSLVILSAPEIHLAVCPLPSSKAELARPLAMAFQVSHTHLNNLASCSLMQGPCGHALPHPISPVPSP